MANFTSNTASLEAVLDKVNAANNEVAAQTELMSQIMTALEGKSVPGGSGGTSVETCTVMFTNFTSCGDRYPVIYQTVENSNVVTKIINDTETSSITVLCGSMFVGIFSMGLSDLNPSDGITMYGPYVADGSMACVFAFQVDLPAGATGTITNENEYGGQ